MEILKHKALLSIAVVLLIASCVKKATIKLPAPESKLVITCFIAPGDSVIVVSVKSSVPEINQSGPYYNPSNVGDASVVLSSDTKTVTLPYDTDAGYYKIQGTALPILHGQTYRLNVHAPDGRYADASTTVPAEILNFESFDLQANTKDSVSYTFDAKLSVQDVEGTSNYVMAYFESVSVGVPYYDNGSGQVDTITGNTFGPYYDSDERVKKSQYHFSYNGSFAPLVSQPREIAIVGRALNCSREFYLYNQSVDRAQGIGQGNPFAEPVLIYSNVNNGFGCFGAYNVARFKKRIL